VRREIVRSVRWSLSFVLLLMVCVLHAGGLDVPVRTLEGHSHHVRLVAFSPDGGMLASGSRDETIKLWDMATGREVRTLTGHTSEVWSVAFSPDGQTLASGAGWGGLKLWDVATGRELRTLAGHTGLVGSVAFSPDGRMLASGAGDHKIQLWDVATGRELRTLIGRTETVWSVAFSPDGQTLASGSDGQTITLWDVSTPYSPLSIRPSGRVLRTLTGHADRVSSIAFSPDGSILASGSGDETIKLWDVSTGRVLRTLTGHTDTVRSVAFSPDGQTLASGSFDNTIKLWDVGTGRELRTLTGHTNAVYSVAFSPDGQMLASGSYDHTINLWDVDRILRPSEPPVVQFTFTPTRPSTLDTIRFTDQSADPDGRVVSWRWEFGDGNTSTLRNPTHRYTRKGTFTVRLTVTDNDGATATASRQITVVNVRPEAHFALAPSQPSTLDTVRFTDQSTDPDGEVVSWRWEFGDGNTSTLRNPTHRYTHKGTFRVWLTVTDDDGATATATRTIAVVNLPPVASFTVALHIEHLGLVLRRREVTFDASDSHDPDGEIVRYQWDFGDGNTAEGRIVTHTYPEAGTYTVRLTVTDDDGMTDTTEQEVQVVPGGGGGPG